MNRKQRKLARRILIALALFCAIALAEHLGALDALFGAYALWASFALYLIPYLVAGHDVLGKAWRNVKNRDPFDESLLMAIATLGAFAMVVFPGAKPHMAEGAAVMLFYQVGELFQSYAVGKSRASIAEMMDIAPEYANLLVDGTPVEVDPEEVKVGDTVLVRPGERVPLDGTVLTGSSSLDTAALTGESIPRAIHPGDTAVSGCINLDGALSVRVEKAYENSTVTRILELVESASEKKARTENFITRFARVYTPAVTLAAIAVAVVPPLLGAGPFSDWLLRGLTFLVVSCPCALVISVPLGFFSGIGGASRLGVLVKGSTYLEALSHVDTIVFDKTGTLTTGSFRLSSVICADGAQDEALSLAASAEAASTHPIARSVLAAAQERGLRVAPADSVREIAGQGVAARVQEHTVLVGNARLMAAHHVQIPQTSAGATALYVAMDGAYEATLVIEDTLKPQAAQAVESLHKLGVSSCVMLTGDSERAARNVADRLGLDSFAAELMPQDKVAKVEELLARKGAEGTLAFVGDGINDAPVLTRADVGIAMGALGSDAAIEAADVVLMNDNPQDIAYALKLAKKTMRIVRQNIVFALGVKLLILALAAMGIANMWLAVFGDVGVAIIAILNAMRSMRTADVTA